MFKVIVMTIEQFVKLCKEEDIKDGDHSALACIPENEVDKAKLLVKADGIIAGIEVAKALFKEFDPNVEIEQLLNDGDRVKYGDIAFYVVCNSRALLSAERLVLNVMQRMSAIATKTRDFVDAVGELSTKVLDTRKTTPLIRFLEKQAVKIGGGENHRMGLYDMIMLKDNHIDFAGGVKQAIQKTKAYLKANDLNLKIEVETRNLNEVRMVLEEGGIHRIMLDNFSYDEIREAVKLIDGKYETEASGGINLDTVRVFAECGVDYVSVGALTHSVYNMDLSLKAVK
ncbi:putative nicotinate-nucleotide pyrophosphorylase [carboxylating] [Parvicella tangerina]|uniref:Probable nicotinate-nucleotide pyrophosphorylase [carboxylating] n=2 Tax=Parvicella tangerina TaxID=2829795 RepID=A0A916NIX7_9FLAO|nr:putative nicotinate-nucleotide pyrophosphorylase [carboxylating] [Parvicella tangerina]